MAHETTKKERRGLALPALRTAGGYFASRNRYDVAAGDVMRTLLTPIGSVPAKRDFGSALYRMVQDPMLEDRVELVDYVCRDALSKWCPHVVLHWVKVQLVPAKRTMQIKVAFRLVDDATPVERMVEIPLDAVRVVATSGS